MRSLGVLRSWNEERGFGFIAPARGGAELFVHISAFPRDGSRPVAGETLSFELGRGADGRPQAVSVVRTAIGTDATPAGRPARGSRVARGASAAGTGRGLSAWLALGLLLVLTIAAGRWGCEAYKARASRMALERLPALVEPDVTRVSAPDAIPNSTPAATAYRCDGRTHCSQMTSCAEATWFINHCPGTQMDGNHDGVPCQEQWCTGPGGR